MDDKDVSEGFPLKVVIVLDVLVVEDELTAVVPAHTALHVLGCPLPDVPALKEGGGGLVTPQGTVFVLVMVETAGEASAAQANWDGNIFLGSGAVGKVCQFLGVFLKMGGKHVQKKRTEKWKWGRYL